MNIDPQNVNHSPNRYVDSIMAKANIKLYEDVVIHEALNILCKTTLPLVAVVNHEEKVIGVIYDDDLLIEEAILAIPNVVGLFGDVAAWPPSMRRLTHDIKKAYAVLTKDAMNTKFETVKPTDTIEKAATVMHDRRVAGLLVVDDDNLLIGIVTIKAILADLLESVS